MPRYLDIRLVLAVGFARIQWQNLATFGILPLCFADPEDRRKIESGDRLLLTDVRKAPRTGRTL